MKKVFGVAGFLVLASQVTLWGYDTDPHFLKMVPEAIWAAAAGGGTWVTELQITNYGSTTAGILVAFDYGGGTTGAWRVHPGLAQYRSVRFPNILATLDGLDPNAFVYYGRVGALYISAENIGCTIQVQAKIVNGNFGKTLPGMSPVAGTTAAQGRPMVIQDLVKNSMYRTSVGIYNTSSYYTYVVQMTIFDANHTQVGASFNKQLDPIAHMTFNPFTQAGATAGNYENCWLHIEVTSGGSDPRGVMCYGSIANNYTNDTFALLAMQRGAD